MTHRMKPPTKPPVGGGIKFHADAVTYNKAFAEFADAFASNTSLNGQVRRWAQSIARQHREHMGKHQASLDRKKAAQAQAIENSRKDMSMSETPVEETPDPSADAAPVENNPLAPGENPNAEPAPFEVSPEADVETSEDPA